MYPAAFQNTPETAVICAVSAPTSLRPGAPRHQPTGSATRHLGATQAATLAVLGLGFGFSDGATAAVTLDQLAQQLTALQTQVTRLQTANRQLQTQLNTLKQNSVLALGDKLSYDAVSHAAVFAGINVQIVNGEQTTTSTNGYGNLIMGYNETDDKSLPVCKDGQYATEEDCYNHLGNGGANPTWGPNLRTGSHNIVVGRFHSYTRYAGIVAGEDNAINADKASVLGGRRNRGGAEYTVVSAGSDNVAKAIYASITGGSFNDAAASYSSIGGGSYNYTLGPYSSISGGNNSVTEGYGSSIGGGSNNKASGEFSSVTGGASNRALGTVSSVSGGLNRYVDKTYSWRAGNVSAAP